MNRFRAVAAALLVLAAASAHADSMVEPGLYGYGNRKAGLVTHDPATGGLAPGATLYTPNGAPVSDSNPLPVSTNVTVSSPTSIAPVAGTALESGHVLKASAGDLLGFQVNFVTCGTYPCWVMVMDTASVPANGNVAPLVRKAYQVGPNATVAVGWAPGPPLKFLTGITVGCSTSGPFSFTATTQCAISGEVQ